MLKLRGHLSSVFAKKLTKHWPWRQNQGSAFLKFIENFKKIVKNSENPPHRLSVPGRARSPGMDTQHGYAFTNIQWGRFWSPLPQNHRFASPRQVILALDFRCFLNFAF